MIRYTLFLLSILIFTFNCVDGTCVEPDKGSQSTEIAFIIPPGGLDTDMVTDEWKLPGLYSPANLFDGDPATCYARTGESFDFHIIFKKSVYIDEIRVINGFARDKGVFFKNNRVREFNIGFTYRTATDKTGGGECGILTDKSEIQAVKLKKVYFAEEVGLTNSFVYEGIRPSESIYKGSKYNDTCVSEIEFYYKGKKVVLTNIDELKKQYVKNIQKDLVNLLSERSYKLSLKTDDDSRDDQIDIETNRDGTIKYTSNMWSSKIFINNIKKMPDMWKVENSTLHMRINGKWVLQKYKIKRGMYDTPIGLFIFTMPFDGFPKGGYLQIYGGDE